jgi:hypothetical protein
MLETKLTDRESLVLALFRYGLAATPDEVVTILGAQRGEVRQICRSLARVGLMHMPASR